MDHKSGDIKVVGEEGFTLQDISPDGRKILYSTSGNLYIMNIDGSNPIMITNEFDDSYDDLAAYWSSFDEIVFIGKYEDLNAIFKINTDGTNLQRITGKDEILSLYPTFENIGVFWEHGWANSRGVWTGPIWWSNKDGEEHTELDIKAPSFSPVGNLFAYVQERPYLTLFIGATNDSNDFEPIGSYSAKKGSIDRYYYSISPDEEKIFVQERIYLDEGNDFAHYVISPDGALIKEFPDDIHAIPYSKWSPDSQLYFVYFHSQEENTHDKWGILPAYVNINSLEITSFDIIFEFLDIIRIRQVHWIPSE